MRTRIFLVITLITAVFSLNTLFCGMTQSAPPDPGDEHRPVTRPKPPKPKGVLSDLKVDQVWLDAQGSINFRLRNAGKYTMPDNEHKGGMVRVYFGKDHEDFYLGKVSAKKKDPVDQKGALKKPGKAVAFNTKIVLKEQRKVKVYVGAINKITLPAKRKGKSLTLMPLGGQKEKVPRDGGVKAGPMPKPVDPNAVQKQQVEPWDGTYKCPPGWHLKEGSFKEDEDTVCVPDCNWYMLHCPPGTDKWIDPDCCSAGCRPKPPPAK